MSKHQELCCGCIYDDPNNEELYCLECFECEFKQSEMTEPSNFKWEEYHQITMDEYLENLANGK